MPGRKRIDQFAMSNRQCATRYTQTAIWLARERSDGAFDLGCVARIGLTSTPSDGATDWITAYWPIPAGIVGSQRTAARVTLGAICLRSSSHLPLKLYSNCMKPDAFPPGCDRDRKSTRLNSSHLGISYAVF